VVAEAFALAIKAGVDPAKVRAAGATVSSTGWSSSSRSSGSFVNWLVMALRIEVYEVD
jgi:3-hydroxyisobutyrate dehydrogenase-like beta-hydroxyacid dehydrogenase